MSIALSSYSQAFNTSNAPLIWLVPDKSEIIGRAYLFLGTYQAFRKACAHREKDEKITHQYREFLLINPNLDLCVLMCSSNLPSE